MTLALRQVSLRLGARLLIAPFSLDRFARDRTMADRGSAGTH